MTCKVHVNWGKRTKANTPKASHIKCIQRNKRIEQILNKYKAIIVIQNRRNYWGYYIFYKVNKEDYQCRPKGTTLRPLKLHFMVLEVWLFGRDDTFCVLMQVW